MLPSHLIQTPGQSHCQGGWEEAQGARIDCLHSDCIRVLGIVRLAFENNGVANSKCADRRCPVLVGYSGNMGTEFIVCS